MERKKTKRQVFGTRCYILADREQRRKSDPKSDEGIFMGYSTNSRAYRVYNERTKTIMESINVVDGETLMMEKMMMEKRETLMMEKMMILLNKQMFDQMFLTICLTP
ncbi:gag-pol polyprotein [Trifolium medium]|uniref:Gag-pol polyprotein n=1 Tax=Trifolium medium TaxID=97028 RepID=A0A392M8X1_9FABA|nr:gag-pol polyprotein [Trifolium medium]